MNDQAKIEKILETIEEQGFSIHPYEEDGVLCGYELEDWTPGGVDMFVFLDCRDDGITADNLKSEIWNAYWNFDVDEEIDLHREDSRYTSVFSIRQSVNDFEAWEERLNQLFLAVDKI